MLLVIVISSENVTNVDISFLFLWLFFLWSFSCGSCSGWACGDA